MITLELLGRITDKGKLEVELPPGMTQSNVKVKIEVLDDEQQLVFIPKTGAEIAAFIESDAFDTSAWTHIQDSAVYVEDIRRKMLAQRFNQGE